MAKHPAAGRPRRRALFTVLLTGSVALAACGADPSDAPIRSATPSGAWTAPSAAAAADGDEALVCVVSAIPGASRFDLFAGRQNRASLRVIHAAADAGRIDAALAGRTELLVDGLPFQDASPFESLPAAPAAIEIRPAGRTETTLRVPDVRPASGGMYTAILTGRTRIDPALETILIEDRLAGTSAQ